MRIDREIDLGGGYRLHLGGDEEGITLLLLRERADLPTSWGAHPREEIARLQDALPVFLLKQIAAELAQVAQEIGPVQAPAPLVKAPPAKRLSATARRLQRKREAELALVAAQGVEVGDITDL